MFGVTFVLYFIKITVYRSKLILHIIINNFDNVHYSMFGVTVVLYLIKITLRAKIFWKLEYISISQNIEYYYGHSTGLERTRTTTCPNTSLPFS
jgi:hypothetical protein